MIPKPDHLITFQFKEGSSLFIIFLLFQMLTAIYFNNEFLAWRTKINNIISNSMLTPKVKILHLMCAKLSPEFYFSIRHIMAEF